MIAKTIIVLWTLFCGYGLFSGLANIGQTPGLAESIAGQVGATLGIFLWLILWFLVVVPTVLIAFLWNRNQGSSGGGGANGGGQRKGRPPLTTNQMIFVAGVVVTGILISFFVQHRGSTTQANRQASGTPAYSTPPADTGWCQIYQSPPPNSPLVSYRAYRTGSGRSTLHVDGVLKNSTPTPMSYQLEFVGRDMRTRVVKTFRFWGGASDRKPVEPGEVRRFEEWITDKMMTIGLVEVRVVLAKGQGSGE